MRSSSRTWTELGQLDALVYPTCVPLTACTNTMLRTVYNAYQGGRLVAVRPYYAAEITYHPNGMLTQVRHTARAVDTAAGVAERVDADPNAMGRPYRIYTDGATLPGPTSGVEGDWSNGYYSYDGAGNIKGLLKASDTLKPGDDTFTYDKVSRLTQAKVALGVSIFVTQDYVYDAWGNLTSYGGQPRAVDPPTSNHLDDASYDAAGNQTGWLFDTGLNRYTYVYGYDRLNQMRYVNGPDGQHRVLAYDADGERVVERDIAGGTTTFTLRGLDGALLREVELKNGAYDWVKDYVYRDGQLLASQHRTEGHQHYHLDHLGTTRMLTNRCGEQVKRYEQFPFGDTISAPANDTEKRRFTGHQRDIGSTSNSNDDLEYMHARYYGMKMGRLLSVDPGGSRPTRPLSWNRYAYTVGNPQNLVDPDGRAWQPPKWLNTLASIGTGLLPGAGEVQDATIALSGYDPVTSERLGVTDRWISGLSLAVPFVGGRLVAKVVGVAPVFRGAGEVVEAVIGFAEGTGRSALTAGRLQHASRHLTEAGLLGNWSKGTAEKFIQIASGILEKPMATCDYVLRGNFRVKGFLGAVDGKPVVIFVYKDGELAGKVATAIVPSSEQLGKMFRYTS